jgi:diguanylate cyclase (GGDEF)-like protein
MADLRIPLLVAAAMALAFGVALLALRHSLATTGSSVRQWAQADLVAGAGLLFAGLHREMPDMLTHVVGDALFVAAIAMQHHALRAFGGVRGRTALEASAVALVCAQAVAFAYVTDEPGLRTAAFAAVMVVLLASLAATALTRPVRAVPGATLIGATAAMLLALTVVRTATIIVAYGRAADSMRWHPIQVPFYYSLGPFVALVNLGFVVMVDARRRTELERLASVDALTGVLNRRMLLTVAAKALSQARRGGRPLALLMLDLDRFKALNDVHGHAAGDAALARFARTAERAMRAGDVLGRYGGEEFVALLPDTTGEEARAVGERVRALAEAETHAGGLPACTVSVGVAAAADARTCSLEELLRRADDALYRAKGTRNAVAGDDERGPRARTAPLAR